MSWDSRSQLTDRDWMLRLIRWTYSYFFLWACVWGGAGMWEVFDSDSVGQCNWRCILELLFNTHVRVTKSRLNTIGNSSKLVFFSTKLKSHIFLHFQSMSYDMWQQFEHRAHNLRFMTVVDSNSLKPVITSLTSRH